MDTKSILAYIEHREQNVKSHLENTSVDSWKATYQMVLNELSGIRNVIESLENTDKAMGVK